jgi:hypothetical protein
VDRKEGRRLTGHPVAVQTVALERACVPGAHYLLLVWPCHQDCEFAVVGSEMEEGGAKIERVGFPLVRSEYLDGFQRIAGGDGLEEEDREIRSYLYSYCLPHPDSESRRNHRLDGDP